MKNHNLFSREFELLKSVGALNPGNLKFMNFNTHKYYINQFELLDINCSLLELEIEKAKTDLQLGLLINP